MSESTPWGQLEPRRGCTFETALIVDGPTERTTAAGRTKAYLTLQTCKSTETFSLPLSALLRPYPTLRSSLLRDSTVDARRSYALAAALEFRNSGLPVVFVRNAEGQPERPDCLFDSFSADASSMAVVSNHRTEWLQDHVVKHFVAETAATWKQISAKLGCNLPGSDIVASLRRWSGDLLRGDALPRLEMYSLLAAASFARPGPLQAEARWRSPWRPAQADLARQLQRDYAKTAMRASPGVDVLLCATIPGAFVVAKGRPGVPKGWSTLHLRELATVRSTIEKLSKLAPLDVRVVDS